jgi:predicted lipoprotein with Yx(FWY)xxD motif
MPRYLGEIATTSVRGRRDEVYAALKGAGLYTGGNDSMAGLAATAGHCYSWWPMAEKAGNPA